MNIQDRGGDTPLIRAVLSKNQGAVHKLLKAGANVNQQNNMGAGDTALHNCVVQNFQDGLVELLEAGADPNISDHYGYTPLMRASDQGFRHFVGSLLQAGADVNKQANSGQTALILATAKGHADCVKLLIQAGADLDVTAEDGVSAILGASQENKQKCLSLLLNVGGKVSFDWIETIVDKLAEKLRSDEEEYFQSVLKHLSDEIRAFESLLRAGVIPDSAGTAQQKQDLEGESFITGPKGKCPDVFGHQIFS